MHHHDRFPDSKNCKAAAAFAYHIQDHIIQTVNLLHKNAKHDNNSVRPNQTPTLK